MLSSAHRLRKSADIAATVRTGTRIDTRTVRAYIRPPGADTTRVACVVSKKVAALATARHRYQRWLREWVQETLPTIVSPADIVIVAKSPITTLPTLQSLRDDLQPLHHFLSKPHA